MAVILLNAPTHLKLISRLHKAKQPGFLLVFFTRDSSETAKKNQSPPSPPSLLAFPVEEFTFLSVWLSCFRQNEVFGQGEEIERDPQVERRLDRSGCFGINRRGGESVSLGGASLPIQGQVRLVSPSTMLALPSF